MRQSIFTIALAALLVSRAASAAGGKEASGKGSAGPSSSAGEGPSPGGNEAGGTDLRDRAGNGTDTAKVWDVGVGLEYHHLLAPSDVTSPVNKNVNYWSLTARWDITPYDRLALSAGLYQYFISDQGESGARLDDMLISYTRRIPLPSDVTLRITPAVVLPTSYASQLAGVYVEPRLGVSVEKRFGRFFSLDARVRGSVFIVKGASGGASFADAGLGGFSGTAPGGTNPNPKGSLAMRLTADLAMPFHEPLSISLSGYTSYTWLYDVCGNGNGSADGGTSAFGMTTGTGGTCSSLPVTMQVSQPNLQTYGYELTAKYQFPSLKGFKADLAFTFAPLGDPTLGYTSVNAADGARHIVGYYREKAEIYAAVDLHY